MCVHFITTSPRVLVAHFTAPLWQVLEENKLKEIKNGRLAMLAFLGFVAQHAATGKVILLLPSPLLSIAALMKPALIPKQRCRYDLTARCFWILHSIGGRTGVRKLR